MKADSTHYWIVVFTNDGPFFDGAYFIREWAEDAARWWSRQPEFKGFTVHLLSGRWVGEYQGGRTVERKP